MSCQIFGLLPFPVWSSPQQGCTPPAAISGNMRGRLSLDCTTILRLLPSLEPRTLPTRNGGCREVEVETSLSHTCHDLPWLVLSLWHVMRSMDYSGRDKCLTAARQDYWYIGVLLTSWTKFSTYNISNTLFLHSAQCLTYLLLEKSGNFLKYFRMMLMAITIKYTAAWVWVTYQR